MINNEQLLINFSGYNHSCMFSVSGKCRGKDPFFDLTRTYLPSGLCPHLLT